MPDVFINYRTSDEANAAKLIDLDLSRRFGAPRIFFASKSIRAGENFPEALRRGVRASRVLLAVIGVDWLTARNALGRNALDDEQDWIRREIIEAFDAGLHVIPVLVDGAPRLSAGALPPELRALGECEYRRFNHRDAERDLDRLSRDIVELVPGLEDATAAEPGGAPAPPQHNVYNTARDVSGFLIQARDVSGGVTVNNTDGLRRRSDSARRSTRPDPDAGLDPDPDSSFYTADDSDADDA
jgi:hypothetical protein